MEMRKVFISSVVGGFEEFRAASKRAVELMGDRPIMCEDFGARPHSSETACITEVESSDAYILVLGQRFGYSTPDDISVTQAEFRAAKKVGKPILVFVQNTEMEPEHMSFRQEVEDYQMGLFRAEFSDPEELKDEIVKGLRQLGQVLEAASENDFIQKTKSCFECASQHFHNNQPELNFSFWPQPVRQFDIVQLENGLDKYFGDLCAAGLASMRNGYEPILEKEFTGLRSKDTKLFFYHYGFLLISLNPTNEISELAFSNHYAPPSRLKTYAQGIPRFFDFNGAWCGVQLRNLQHVCVEELPPTGTNTFSMRGYLGGADTEAHFHKCLIPLTEKSFQEWIDVCVNRFRRIFAK
jgi:hypothetical protein